MCKLNFSLQALAMGMMTEYYHYIFTTLVSSLEEYANGLRHHSKAFFIRLLDSNSKSILLKVKAVLQVHKRKKVFNVTFIWNMIAMATL